MLARLNSLAWQERQLATISAGFRMLKGRTTVSMSPPASTWAWPAPWQDSQPFLA